MKERRRYPRYDITLEVEYDFTNDVEIQSKTHTLNVSKVGIAVPLCKAIKPGKKLKLKLKLPHEGKEINATGRVVWRSPLDNGFASEENAGIEFLDMDFGSRLALRDFIRTCEAS